MDMACSKCGKIYTEIQKCPSCNVQLTRDWSGRVALIDPEKSKVAKQIDSPTKGMYALKI
jgi:DNA-directed RNA polymerase subunit E"